MWRYQGDGVCGTLEWDVWAQGTSVGQVCRDPEVIGSHHIERVYGDTGLSVRGRYRSLSWEHRGELDPKQGTAGRHGHLSWRLGKERSPRGDVGETDSQAGASGRTGCLRWRCSALGCPEEPDSRAGKTGESQTLSWDVGRDRPPEAEYWNIRRVDLQAGDQKDWDSEAGDW